MIVTLLISIFVGLLFVAHKDRQQDNAFEQTLKDLEYGHRVEVYGEGEE